MSDDARKKILKRRSAFVAAAIASVTASAACERAPRVCLKVAPQDSGAAVEDSAPADAEPVDTGAPAANAPEPGAPDATAPVMPSVCLKIAPPKKDAG